MQFLSSQSGAKKVKISSASLTDHSHKARDQTKQHMATILKHKNKLHW